jgi:ABC-type branched-subunit amino acid transport system substrate-binding protein
MNKSFPKTLWIVFICFLLILSCAPAGQRSTETPSAGDKPEAKEAETIKIGLIAPFSGAFWGMGPYFHAGIKFAVKEQNAKGGILGKQIEIIKGDSKFKPDVATRIARKLILEDKVNFIVSGGGSHEALALNRVATQHKTIFINIDQTDDSLQGEDFSRYAFRVCANNHAMTSALAQFMATKPHRKYYIISPDYDYGHDLANAYKKQIKQYVPDAQIVGEDYHTLKTRQFGPYINNVKAAKADAVFSGSFADDLYYLIRQARDQGLAAPFPIVTANALYRTDVRKEDAPGIFSAAGYTMLVDTSENKAMVAKYHKQHKYDKYWRKWVDPRRGSSIIGWQMVFAAIEKAGSLDPEKIITTFEGFRYKTPVGWWQMRKCDHQVMLPMFGMAAKAAPNPYYPGTLYGPDIVKISAEETAIPATSDYNPRCP